MAGARPVTARAAAHRRIEAASLDLPHPGLAAAIERFEQHRDPAFRLGLARDIAQTRRGELTLAYRNVLTVAAGWRLKRHTAGAPAQRPREPCVVLVVRRKWRKGHRPADLRQQLPAHLLVHAEHEGTRRLYAVPTDVQAADAFVGGRANGATAVVVQDPAMPAIGTLTCAVRLTPADGGAPHVRMLSAMHVFTPFAEVAAGPGDEPASVFREPHPEPGGLPAQPAVGTTSTLRGRLLRNDFSFDAQLATAADTGWLRRQLVGMRLSAEQPFVSSPEALDRLNAVNAEFTLLAADNHRHHGAVQIKLGSPTTDLSSLALDYRLRDSGSGQPADPHAPLATVAIFHWELLQFDVLGFDVPVEGDSGAPVLARRGDGSLTLVGMFIASNEETRKAYVLPAWQLFDAENWNRDGRQLARIEPVNL